MKKDDAGAILRITGLYAIVALLWITISDRFLILLTEASGRVLTLSTLKGWGFVIVTAGLLAVLLQREFATRHKVESAHQLSETLYRELADSITDILFALDSQLRYIFWNKASEQLTGLAAQEALGKSLADIFPSLSDSAVVEMYKRVLTTHQHESMVFPFMKGEQQTIFEVNAYPSVLGVFVHVRDVTERERVEAILQESEQRFRMLYEQAPLGYQSLDQNGHLLEVNQAWLSAFGYEREAVIGQSIENFLAPAHQALFRQRFPNFKRLGEIHGVEFEMQRKDGSRFWSTVDGRIGRDAHGNFQQTHCILTDITQRRQHEREMETIAALSMNLRSATSRAQMLPVILNQTQELMEAEGASITIPIPETGELMIEMGSGKSEGMQGFVFPRGQGIVSYVYQTGELYHTHDVLNDPRLYRPNMDIAPSAACLPLITSDQTTTGVLWVNRVQAFDEGDLRLLRIIAEIGANAVHRATIFENLKQANYELNSSYDETIEGWSRALDLRDRETEGHSERVTELTLQLAQTLGIPDAELVHIRRGALLHDIGKMGIPDAILNKPGPLNAAEWEIMRQHPVYAYRLLSPIGYLRPALDIPYCHHEKWDGSGYPRGLMGEDIPLAARIFALADVWDALCSDRPYRMAYSPEMARRYIQEQAGKHFDPKATGAFLACLDQ